MTVAANGQAISLQHVRKVWGQTVSLEDLSLEVPAESFTAVLGPSGCGKSTTLRIIAGLESVSAGKVLIGGRDVTEYSPAQRGISMVFQSYALFPHLTVAENIVFGLKVANVPRQERQRRLTEVAELLELAPYLATAAIAFVFSVPYRQAIRVRRKQGVQLIIDATISVFMVAIALSGPSGMVSWISMTSSLMVAQNLALMLYVNRIFAKTNPS